MNRLLVSFSGGLTSGYMTRRILDTWRDRYDDIVVLFANTGCEHEKTLEFINNCDKEFGFNTVWLEAVTQKAGVGSAAKVVNFETASRKGEPYIDAVKKYGIFNAAFPNCTDRVKLMPMRHYTRHVLGWEPGSYDQCVGIRVDEIDRMSIHADKMRIQYPLIKWMVTKTMVLDWWKQQPFDLEIEDHYGNCVWCWKKSKRKLLTIAKEAPEYFDVPLKLEEEYGTRETSTGNRAEGITFFRNNVSAKDIIARSKEPFVPHQPTIKEKQIGMFSLDEMDYSNGCTESCEVDYV